MSQAIKVGWYEAECVHCGIEIHSNCPSLDPEWASGQWKINPDGKGHVHEGIGVLWQSPITEFTSCSDAPKKPIMLDDGTMYLKQAQLHVPVDGSIKELTPCQRLGKAVLKAAAAHKGSLEEENHDLFVYQGSAMFADNTGLLESMDWTWVEKLQALGVHEQYWIDAGKIKKSVEWVVKEADPEFEKLLAEEAEIELCEARTQLAIEIQVLIDQYKDGTKKFPEGFNTWSSTKHVKKLAAGQEPGWTIDWPKWYHKHGISKHTIQAAMPMKECKW